LDPLGDLVSIFSFFLFSFFFVRFFD